MFPDDFPTGCMPPPPAWIGETRARLKRERDDALAREKERAKQARAEESEREAREERELRATDPYFDAELRMMHTMAERLFARAKPGQSVWLELREKGMVATLLTLGAYPYGGTVEVTAESKFDADELKEPWGGPPAATRSAELRGALARDFVAFLKDQGANQEHLTVDCLYVGFPGRIRAPCRRNVWLEANGQPKLRDLELGDWVVMLEYSLDQ